MSEAFGVTFREGLEAFVIIATASTFFRRTGRATLVRTVYWALAASIPASLALTIAFERASNHALWEGALAIAAAIGVAYFGADVRRAVRSGMTGRGVTRASAVASSSRIACVAVLVFVLLMVTREGIEMLSLTRALLFDAGSARLAGGAVAGALTAAGLAAAWGRYERRLSADRALQVTTAFIALFVFQLAVYGFHHLTEANVLPYSQPLHEASEPYGPDGRYGRYLSYVSVALPLAFLAATGIRSGVRRRMRPITPA